jgi:hypothetical protein
MSDRGRRSLDFCVRVGDSNAMNTDRPTFTAYFGPGNIYTRQQVGRRPFTHAALAPTRTAGPRRATFHRSEQDARAFATKRGQVVVVTVAS